MNIKLVIFCLATVFFSLLLMNNVNISSLEHSEEAKEEWIHDNFLNDNSLKLISDGYIRMLERTSDNQFDEVGHLTKVALSFAIDFLDYDAGGEAFVKYMMVLYSKKVHGEGSDFWFFVAKYAHLRGKFDYSELLSLKIGEKLQVAYKNLLIEYPQEVIVGRTFPVIGILRHLMLSEGALEAYIEYCVSENPAAFDDADFLSLSLINLFKVEVSRLNSGENLDKNRLIFNILDNQEADTSYENNITGSSLNITLQEYKSRAPELVNYIEGLINNNKATHRSTHIDSHN
ncbi:hypothetical protein [Paraferrimonas sp. SM1919]|uniref:hypothetical protein n=1 Tax=Paraferrimonas sp. SM1919 TaxID=2662263 RepID=UPI0013D28ECE|nr:hypothetical protein [Paraferrimonas sp. SM1919]